MNTVPEKQAIDVQDFSVGSLSIGNGAPIDAVAGVLGDRLNAEVEKSPQAIEGTIKGLIQGGEEVTVLDSSGRLFKWKHPGSLSTLHGSAGSLTRPADMTLSVWEYRGEDGIQRILFEVGFQTS